MNSIITYLTIYWQPLLLLLMGTFIVIFFVCIQRFGDIKQKAVHWLATIVLRNKFMSEKSINDLFTVVAGFLVSIGGIWIILAILYLTN